MCDFRKAKNGNNAPIDGKKKREIMNRTNILSAVLAGIFMTVMVVGCSGVGQMCSAIITVDGRTHGGTDRDLEEAKRKVCTRYCLDGDAEFDKAYEDWLRSPESRGIPDRESRGSARRINPALKEIAKKCETKCAADMADGSLKVNVRCK